MALEIRHNNQAALRALHFPRLNSAASAIEFSLAGCRVHAHGVYATQGDTMWRAWLHWVNGGPVEDIERDWGLHVAVCMDTTCSYVYLEGVTQDGQTRSTARNQGAQGRDGTVGTGEQAPARGSELNVPADAQGGGGGNAVPRIPTSRAREASRFVRDDGSVRHRAAILRIGTVDGSGRLANWSFDHTGGAESVPAVSTDRVTGSMLISGYTIEELRGISRARGRE